MRKINNDLLPDSNIVFNIIKAKDFTSVQNFINPEEVLLYISIVSEAEVKSLSARNKWGLNRKKALDIFLGQLSIIDVNQLSVNIYAEIDAYSQRLNPNFEDYPFETPRNMGKNDLWIAALAALLGLKLVTADADFDHLHNVFFEVKKIKPAEFLPFF